MSRFPLRSISGFLRRFPVRTALLLAACFVACLPAARAETAAYASFGASNFNTPNVGWQYGPTFGLYYNAWRYPFLGVGLDARATLLGSGSTKAYMGLAGPRIQFHPHVLPLNPYVEGLVGAGQVDVGEGFATQDKFTLAYEAVAGVDWTVLPHIDWRVAEFSYGGFASLNGTVTPRTISTGIVVRLP